jgi:hypothetical protein
MSKILLEEEDPDHATLEDMTSELANFIVGHAKMVASEKATPYRMGTPSFGGIGPIETEGETFLFKVDDHCFAVSVKVIDG